MSEPITSEKPFKINPAHEAIWHDFRKALADSLGGYIMVCFTIVDHDGIPTLQLKHATDRFPHLQLPEAASLFSRAMALLMPDEAKRQYQEIQEKQANRLILPTPGMRLPEPPNGG